MASNLATVEGDIVSSTYESSWGVASSEIPTSGTVLFMDVGFTIGNAVYLGDKAMVTMSDTLTNFPTATSGGAAVKCWVIDALVISTSAYTTCTTNGSVITLPSLPKSSASTTFKFRILATTVITSEITSVETQNLTNLSIDKTISGGTLKTLSKGTNLNEAVVAETEMGLDTKTATGFGLIAGIVDAWAGDATAGSLRFQWKSAALINATSTITVKLPVNTTAAANNSWFVPLAGIHIRVGGGADDDGFAVVTSVQANPTGASLISGNLVGSTTGLGSITIINSAGVDALATTTANNKFYVVELQTTSGTAKQASNPLVSSNASTYYEVWITVTNGGAGTTTTGLVFQPVIADRVLGTSTATYYSCKSSAMGNVAVLDTAATGTAVPDGYFVDIMFAIGTGANTFTTGLGSDLVTGDDYPYSATVPAGTPSVKVAGSTNDIIRVTTPAVLAAGEILDVFYLSVDDTPNSVTGDTFDANAVPLILGVSTYADVRIASYIYYEAPAATLTAAAGGLAAWSTLAAVVGTEVYNNAAASLTIKMEEAGTYGTTPNLTIVFPKGTILTSTALWKNKVPDATNYDSAITKLALWSTNAKYNFPVLVTQVTEEGSGAAGIATGTGIACEIQGATTRAASYTASAADATRPI